MEIRKEEEQNLNKILNVIDTEIIKANQDLKSAISHGQKLSFEDRLRGEHFNVNSRAKDATERIKTLTESKPIPYFGRIEVSMTDKTSDKLNIYIGKNDITSSTTKYVTDWRAPICSLYYDGQIGPASYKMNGTEMNTYLLSKRQITIKNSKLINAVDTELVSNDELLKPYLETNADNKMKTIIASIQREQNNIIRKPSDKNMIIQGVAGSGKTSVALHRISYQLYEANSKLTPDSFLILGPNDYFLNYVANVLPDLDTASVKEETFLNFTKDYIGEKIAVKLDTSIQENSSTANIQLFKTSLEYRDLLEKFMQKYIEEFIVPYDFKIMDDVIFTKEAIRKMLFSLNMTFPDYDRAYLMLKTKLKDNYEQIYNEINAKYKQAYKTMPFDDPKRKEIVEYSGKLYSTLKNDGVKLSKKYLKEIKLTSQQIYAMFIDYLSEAKCPLTDKEKLIFQKETLNDLKKKKVGFEDLAPLIYISYRLSNKTTKFKQVVIDEAQDYGLFHFDVLKKTNPQAYFTIYGDLAQAIYPYRSISSWEELRNKVFDKNIDKSVLSKSYRTTMEITENANNVLKHMNLEEATPVIRHGNKVKIIEGTDSIFKVDRINRMIDKGFQTIAIICKEEKEVKKVHKELEEYKLDSKIILPTDNKYNGGLFVLTAAASKGLEFDGVIINNASINKYDEKSMVDMHLLYVAVTRALHELDICYSGKMVNLFSEKQIEKSNNLVKTKVKKK